MTSSTETMQRWPRPPCDPGNQPHFILIITPPNSGSTALAQLINTSPRAMLLRPNGEGQWLIPGMCETDRWNPDKEIDYESVHAVWLSAYQAQHALNSAVCVVIEKSPPNMVRIHRLIDLFDRVSLLAMNRNPYANCSSIFHRQQGGSCLSVDRRIEILQGLARDWIARSCLIAALLDIYGCPLLTYEEFCVDPSCLNSVPNFPPEILSSICPSGLVRVKDYAPQQIMCCNERQVSLLSEMEIRAIGFVLRNHLDLLDRFGYRILP